jgi:N4-gp56 family major capsid protein
MSNTTYGSISQRTAAWAATEMLSHAEPVMVLHKFGQSKPLPKNKADNVKFRRPVPFAAATTPLVEGVTPTAQALQYEDVPVTINQYGAVVVITDKVNDLAEDPVLKDASMLCGEQAGETMEAITWGVVKGGTNVAFANGSGVGDVNTAISLNKIRGATRFLMAQRAKRLTKMLSGSADYATKPIEAAYVAFGHTDMEADIRNLAGFTPVAAYGSRQPLCAEEVGSVESVRFILSPMLTPTLAAGSATLNGMKSVGGANVDVYDLVIIGQEAYGLVPLKGAGAITPKVLNPDTPDKSDPLGQRGYVSWKSYFAAVRLNEAWLVRVRVAVTNL